jgi:hypothetical protein
MNWKHTDKLGNEVVCIDKVVCIKLAQEKKIRGIGFYNVNDNFIKGCPNALNPSKHKFKTNNGYGVNYWVVDRLPNKDNKVIFITEEGNYYITKEKILECKGVKQFSKQGFELQYIIPLSEMEVIPGYKSICLSKF